MKGIYFCIYPFFIIYYVNFYIHSFIIRDVSGAGKSGYRPASAPVGAGLGNILAGGGAEVGVQPILRRGWWSGGGFNLRPAKTRPKPVSRIVFDGASMCIVCAPISFKI